MQNPDTDYSKRIITAVSVTAIMTVYLIYSAGLFFRIAINSDYANLVLEASDILSGNIFLTDWNLTGITFITTDLFYFIISVIIAGTTINAYYIAIILMYFTLVLGALLLLKTKNKSITITDVLIFLAVGGFPCEYACDVLRAHTPVPAYFFLSIFFGIRAYYSLTKELNKKAYIYFFIYTLLLALGCAGDPIMLIIGITPVVLVCLYSFISNKTVNKKINIIFLLLSIFSVVLGKIIEIVFVRIGNVNKNSFLDTRTFISAELIDDKFNLYMYSLLGMFDASFFSQKLTAIDTLWSFLKIIVILIAFYIMFRQIINFIKHKECDIVSVILSIGFLLISVIFIITDISVDIFSARYIGYFPILCGVLIVRYLKLNKILETKLISRKATKKIPVLLYSAVLIISSFAPINFQKPITAQDSLAEYLSENGLTNGYAKFWNASHVTLASNKKVAIRAVTYNKDTGLTKFTWFCKNSWYTPEFSNFVVIQNSDENGDIFGITKKNVRKTIGKPANVLSFEDYTIYVYNVNITDRITK